MSGTPVDFATLFEASPEVLLVLLPDAPRYTMVAGTNARFEATHTTREETMGRGLFELFPDNPDDPAADGMRNLRASLERVIATRAPDTMAVQKYDIRGPDGTFQAKYWSPRNVPVLSASGDVLYILHRVEDVTDLVRASEAGEELRGRNREMEREVVARSRELSAAIGELRAANAKLAELDVAKTAFFDNVSHELRTPLTLMLGPLEDALADGTEPLGAKQATRARLAHDNAVRMLKLVNALLDFARLEAGRAQASFAPVDVGTFTAELAALFESATHEAGLRLRIACPPLREPVLVDRDSWEKIVANLVSNAFKFTLEGEIAVSVREEDARVVLEVRDTGVGIPETELEHVFERFHRVAGTTGRTFEGTGIGLALVRELVALHGGRVTVESVVGRGSTFRVVVPKGDAHLPRDAVSRTAAQARPATVTAAHVAEASRWGATVEPPVPAPRADGAPRASVLLVDDNADVREYVAGILAPHYELATAVDGLDALASVRARRPDVIVSDVMMPRLDGLGLVRELRADPATSSLPVILLSARAGEDSTIEGLDAGSDDYLAKPFSARELLARVRTHVELARVRRAWTEELERTNRELDAFSYSVSHDLRAPLRAIRELARALSEDCGPSLDAAANDFLARIGTNVERMGRLIEDMLALSKVSRAPLAVADVDVGALAREVIGELHAASPARDVTVDIAQDLVARGDAQLLRIVLVNLLSNAWKFTSRRTAARIEVGRTAGPVPTFHVRDDGAGFDPAHAERLFAPFARLHSARDFEGTGIGLATVQRVIARHGGRVWAESAVDRGATFYFTLPERAG